MAGSFHETARKSRALFALSFDHEQDLDIQWTFSTNESRKVPEVRATNQTVDTGITD
jgi:hypothetical protein